MRGAFLVRGTSTLAGDLSLFLWRHRSETASFFANSFHSNPPGYLTLDAIARRRTARDQNGDSAGYKADATAAKTSSGLSLCTAAVYANAVRRRVGPTDVDRYSRGCEA